MTLCDSSDKATSGPATLFFRKRFTSGTLKGLKHDGELTFPSMVEASRHLRFMQSHRTPANVVKAKRGSFWFEDFSFQKFAR